MITSGTVYVICCACFTTTHIIVKACLEMQCTFYYNDNMIWVYIYDDKTRKIHHNQSSLSTYHKSNKN